jgi:hypothetical protein
MIEKCKSLFDRIFLALASTLKVSLETYLDFYFLRKISFFSLEK